MSQQPEQTQKAYTSLANKYRPQTFEAVVGQDSVSKTLMNAIRSGRISHAYLFYGPRGCGKTTSARLLAKALNCTGGAQDKPNPSPCGKCPQCLEIAASSDMDVLELDAASNTQVEKVREAIIETVSLAAGRDRYKVFILDEVHMLSTSSFNALLKTIEEPPSHVVFILATTELHKVPLTISSRCQTFRFKPITEEQSTTHIMDLAEAEGIDIEPAAAAIIAKNAGGALRDALTILDRAIAYCGGKITQDAVGDMLGLMPKDLVQAAATAMVGKDALALHAVFETIKKEGFDALGLLKDLKNAFGNLFYFSIQAAPEPFAGAADILKETSAVYIAGLTRKISKLIEEVKFSDTPLLSSEVGLFTIMESTLDLEQFLNRLSAMEAALSDGDYTSDTEKKTLNNPHAPQDSAQIMPKTIKSNIITEGYDSAPPPKVTIKADIAPTAKPHQKSTQSVVATGNNTTVDTDYAWPAFKAELSAHYPFLHESLLDGTVSFPPGNQWQIAFNPADEFSLDIMKRRLNDLKKISKKVTGADIEFTFKLDGSVKKAVAIAIAKPMASRTPAQPKAIANAVVPKSVPIQAKLTGQNSIVISDEEPFVKGDFSAVVTHTAPPTIASTKQPIQTQQAVLVKEVFSTTATAATTRVLNIIEGTLVEEL